MATKKKPTTKPKPAAAPHIKTTFREGTAKAKAFAEFKAKHKEYDALACGGKKEWQEALAKNLKLSAATVASWCGGQFRAALGK
jgi:hypothetical protein